MYSTLRSKDEEERGDLVGLNSGGIAQTRFLAGRQKVVGGVFGATDSEDLDVSRDCFLFLAGRSDSGCC